MYSIPPNFDIKKIENETVNQISFGLNFVLFSFPNGFIQFSGSFTFLFEDLEIQYEEVCPVENDFRLLHLLEKQIVLVDTNKDRTELTIKFSDKSILTLIGNERYESFTVSAYGEEVMV